MTEMIITSQCETCIHGTIDETNIARIKVYCDVKGKTYCYGQCVPCNCYNKRRGSEFGRTEQNQ